MSELEGSWLTAAHGDEARTWASSGEMAAVIVAERAASTTARGTSGSQAGISGSAGQPRLGAGARVGRGAQGERSAGAEREPGDQRADPVLGAEQRRTQQPLAELFDACCRCASVISELRVRTVLGACVCQSVLPPLLLLCRVP